MASGARRYRDAEGIALVGMVTEPRVPEVASRRTTRISVDADRRLGVCPGPWQLWRGIRIVFLPGSQVCVVFRRLGYWRRRRAG